MLEGKKIVAIIPARSGSKGLKDKNIKALNGKPLISYTIESAIQSQLFEEIIVSTDSEVYAEIARQYGGSTPFLRDKALAKDCTGTSEVIKDVLERLKKQNKSYDYFMILQPTSPLRKAEDILKSVQLLLEKRANAVVSVCECEHPLKWCIALDEELSLEGFNTLSNKSRRQVEEKYYRLNGAIYLANTAYYLKDENFYKDKCYAYVMNKKNSIDIDDIYDFKLAEVILKEESK